MEGFFYLSSENKDADQLRLCLHMQNAGILMTLLIYGRGGHLGHVTRVP